MNHQNSIVMKDNRIYRKLENLIWMAIISVSFIACTDDDIVKNFTPRKGEMMTEYLTTRVDDFSLFVEMLGRTKLNTTPMLDLLSTYGSYTCFAPDNDAILDYLGSIDLESVSSLTDEECEEIVFTHIIEKKEYFTTDMNDGALPSTNLSDRFLTVSCSTDSIGTLSYNINKNSRIIARDDSVSNGVVHKIDKILILSSDMLPDVLTADSSITLFNEALKITGIKDSLYKYIDLNYSFVIDSVETGVYYHTGNEWERAYYLKQRKFMFTVFAEPDSIYQMNGINNINELTAFASRVYDRNYPQNAVLSAEEPTLRKKPMLRFVSYTFLDCLANSYVLVIPVVL